MLEFNTTQYWKARQLVSWYHCILFKLLIYRFTVSLLQLFILTLNLYSSSGSITLLFFLFFTSAYPILAEKATTRYSFLLFFVCSTSKLEILVLSIPMSFSIRSFQWNGGHIVESKVGAESIKGFFRY